MRRLLFSHVLLTIFCSQAARGVHYDADSDQMVVARRCIIGGKWPLRESVLRPVEDITAYVHFLAALMKVRKRKL